MLAEHEMQKASWEDSMARVRIGDVAREAGVSLGTVSNALNHPEKVRPETRRVINETIERLGYLPNQSARMLAGGQSNVLGLVLPRLNHGSSLQIANGALTEARRHGYNLIMANANDDGALSERSARYLMGMQVDGILVQPVQSLEWEPAAMHAVPVIYLDVRSGSPGYYVSADNMGQGALIARHLVTHGATHIAVIGRTSSQQMKLRLTGIQDVLSSHPDIVLEVLDAGEWNVSGDGYSLGVSLMQRASHERPDVIIGLTDVLAAGAIAGALSAGAHVPDDLLVAGCDGNPLAWSGPVALTTCSPAGYEIGRKGIQLLLERIATQDALPHEAHERREEVVRPFLLPRASTGAAPTGGLTTVENRALSIPEFNMGAYL